MNRKLSSDKAVIHLLERVPEFAGSPYFDREDLNDRLYYSFLGYGGSASFITQELLTGVPTDLGRRCFDVFEFVMVNGDEDARNLFAVAILEATLQDDNGDYHPELEAIQEKLMGAETLRAAKALADSWSGISPDA